MSGQSRFVFRADDELRIAFASFSDRIAFHDGRRLTVNVVDGENAGFSDTVDYEAIVVRKGIILLSWQEQIGSTIVHVLDFTLLLVGPLSSVDTALRAVAVHKPDIAILDIDLEGQMSFAVGRCPRGRKCALRVAGRGFP